MCIRDRFDGFAQAAFSLVQTVVAAVDDTQVVQRVGAIGLAATGDGHCLFVGLGGGVELLGLEQQVAQVVQHAGLAGVQRQGAADQGNALVAAALDMAQDAQEVQHLRGVRLFGLQRRKGGLGSRQLFGPYQPDGLLEPGQEVVLVGQGRLFHCVAPGGVSRTRSRSRHSSHPHVPCPVACRPACAAGTRG